MGHQQWLVATKGFLAHLKKEVPNILCVHCMIHRQHLVAKKTSPSLHLSLTVVINAINKIKSNAKNDRVFRKLCEDCDETYVRLILHTEVRWLSKGQCLTRFVELYDTVLQFFENAKEHDMCHKLKTRRNYVFYLADIFTKLNEVNLHLQGKIMTLIECKNVICLFLEKLNLFRQNIMNRELHQFPKLLSIKDDLTISDLEKYSSHLDALKVDMENRFQDIINLKVDAWMETPFNVNTFEVEVTYQEELLQLKYDAESKANFNEGGYLQLWQNKKMPELYPHLWNKICPLLIAFPTSYLVETGFSIVNKILTKERNRMNVAERDLRLFLSRIKPNIKDLVSKHQPQCSH